jgi:cob(I)alamin adenosyltransferase
LRWVSFLDYNNRRTPWRERHFAMKIYTKTGDQGDTGLFGGPRVGKDAPRIEAYGTVDELNSVLGIARAQGLDAEFDALVAKIQNDLFAVGAQLATPDPAHVASARVGAAEIAALEQAIDRFESRLEPLRQFILPGGCPAAAYLHFARTVCRRAERRLVALMRTPSEPIAPEPLVYLNRLSDLLFVMARVANRSAGTSDVPWQKPS